MYTQLYHAFPRTGDMTEVWPTHAASFVLHTIAVIRVLKVWGIMSLVV